DNAYTVGSGNVRLGLVGRSAVGLTSRLELSTYGALDLLLFPNFSIKYRFYDGEIVSASLQLGAGGGAYPVVVGAVLGFIPFGFLGIIGGAYEQAKLDLSFHVAQPFALTLRGGVLGTEV